MRPAGSIPVLSLHQPWASLIAIGVKTIETRSWSTKYRGPLAIHAAAMQPDADADDLGVRLGDWLAFKDGAGWSAQHYASGIAGAPADLPLPLGAIVATCTLVDVVPMVPLCPTPTGPLQHLVVTTTDLHLHAGYVQQSVENQRPYGDFRPGRFAWLLADVVPLSEPAPFKGGQCLSKSWVPS